MLQRYTFLHKTNGNENIFVLNFAKSNNLNVLLPFYRFFGNRNKAVTMSNRLVYSYPSSKSTI